MVNMTIHTKVYLKNAKYRNKANIKKVSGSKVEGIKHNFIVSKIQVRST